MTIPELKVGDKVQTIETGDIGKVIEIGDPYGDGGTYVNVMFYDIILLTMTRDPNKALCEDDTQWYDQADVRPLQWPQ
jgi:hypothetical protein